MMITGPNRYTDTTLGFTRLDDRAAKIIFRDNNKVRVHLLRGKDPLNLGYTRLSRKEWSTSMVFMSRRLSSTQRKQSNLPLVGAMTRSALSLVRPTMRHAAYTLEP
jgi:hypothetical protein